MGAIINDEQHEIDVQHLRTLAELCPVMRRHLSHHLRNALAGIMAEIELTTKNLEEKRTEAIANNLTRAMVMCEHLRGDLEEVGL